MKCCINALRIDCCPNIVKKDLLKSRLQKTLNQRKVGYLKIINATIKISYSGFLNIYVHKNFYKFLKNFTTYLNEIKQTINRFKKVKIEHYSFTIVNIQASGTITE